ncbi:hypothetical protein ACFFK0_12680 [Paenibacillus chartarius]|uniref:Uncharacterized protein n=1 Tax=Paenibacillus chartarius TaxID=747481 RepID=A0ABV6DKW6_9BACL
MKELFYNYFTGTSSLGDAAWTIATAFMRKFNIVGDTYNLVTSLTWKLRALGSAFSGGNPWAIMGGVLLDLGEFLVQFTPAGRTWQIVSWLWTVANVL